MTTLAIEGVGASIAFGTSGFSSDVYSITLPERARESIDTTHLGTTSAKTSKPAKLQDSGTVSVKVDHDPSAVDLVGQDPETITITYPLLTGQATPTKRYFTGYVVSMGGEEMTVDNKMTTNLTIKVTGPWSTIVAT